MKLLSELQKALKVPKGQYNKFGGYAYRSCSDILEAVKPLLGNAALVIKDDVVLIGDRYYVKATVTFSHEGNEVSVTGYAREADSRKGMNADQLTGATSSYARKYALNGLFAIDDAKDSDDMNQHGTGNGTGEDTNGNNKTGPKPDDGNGSGKEGPKPEDDVTKLIADAFKTYCDAFCFDLPQDQTLDPEKFRAAIRERFKKFKPADRKKFVWNRESIDELVSTIQPDEIAVPVTE